MPRPSHALEAHELVRPVRRTLRVRYLLRRPPGRAPRRGWPLLIYLHGAGAKGNDPALLTREPLPALAAQLPFNAILACPQCPAGLSGFRMEDLDGWLDELLRTLPADPRRVLLTGQSMGGRGVYEWAYERADRFAALAPVCAVGLPTLAPRLRGLPVWIFHGALDGVVPFARAKEMHAALRAVGVPAKLTRMAHGGHGIGAQAYTQPGLWRWFEGARRGGV